MSKWIAIGLLAITSVQLGGCAAGGLAILEHSSVDYVASPLIKLYISEVDDTGQEAQYDLKPFRERIAERLKKKKVGAYLYYIKNHTEDYVIDYFKNPFAVTQDSSEAAIIVRIKISVFDYAKLREIESTAEKIGKYVEFGAFPLFRTLLHEKG